MIRPTLSISVIGNTLLLPLAVLLLLMQLLLLFFH